MGRSERYLTDPERQSPAGTRRSGFPTQHQHNPTALNIECQQAGTQHGPAMTKPGATQTEIERRRSEVSRLDDEIRSRIVRRAGLLAEIEELRKSAPQAHATGEGTLGERVVAFVQSRKAAVQTKDVVSHLEESGVDFNPNSVSVLLERKARPGGPLMKVGRGRYEVAHG